MEAKYFSDIEKLIELVTKKVKSKKKIKKHVHKNKYTLGNNIHIKVKFNVKSIKCYKTLLIDDLAQYECYLVNFYV